MNDTCLWGQPQVDVKMKKYHKTKQCRIRMLQYVAWFTARGRSCNGQAALFELIHRRLNTSW